MFKVVEPTTPDQYLRYFNFRWLLLRKPWGYPEGSEKDEYEQVSHHRMVVDDSGEIYAVGRLQINNSEEAQVRHIAVASDKQGKGLGKLILSALENEALKMGIERLVTNSRDTSVTFFESCGFEIIGDAPTELGDLKRQQMMKTISGMDTIIRHPDWCKELQDVWHNEIPISSQMGIKIHQYTGNSFETRASLNKNVNLHGTMFAGSIYSHATLTGWGMIHMQLKELELEGDIVLGDANIHYHKPVTTEPRAVCNIESLKAKYDTLRKGKKMNVKLTVEIFDRTKPVAEFEGIFWVLPKT